MFYFRSGTCDMNVFFDTAVRNSYELPELEKTDIVVDIGTHIGSFLHLAYVKGSRNLVGFEANKENFEIAARHLADEIREHHVRLYNVAVWHTSGHWLFHTGYPQDVRELNTGGGNVFAQDGERVLTMSLDDIITDNKRIDYLKLDCEGSEFPILAASTKLDKVNHIMLEYHEMKTIPDVAKRDELPEYTIAALTTFLAERGFTLTKEKRHGTSNLGMAWFDRS